jgi:hypothetical protein
MSNSKRIRLATVYTLATTAAILARVDALVAASKAVAT